VHASFALRASSAPPGARPSEPSLIIGEYLLFTYFNFLDLPGSFAADRFYLHHSRALRWREFFHRS
jgi:hypothetical protein